MGQCGTSGRGHNTRPNEPPSDESKLRSTPAQLQPQLQIKTIIIIDVRPAAARRAGAESSALSNFSNIAPAMILKVSTGVNGSRSVVVVGTHRQLWI